jgi:putative transposase
MASAIGIPAETKVKPRSGDRILFFNPNNVILANTYTKINIHAIFAVKYRQALLPKSFSRDLYRYMAGIIKSENQFPIRINGMPDHIHLAFSMKPSVKVSDLVRVIKTNSSKWINEQKILEQEFAWQRGFGAFSYGQSQIDELVRYIDNQEAHHQRRSFQEEYLGFLKAFQIEFEEKYLFDWIMDQ